MLPTIGPLEIIAVLLVVLIFFGPKRLPGLGRSLGGGLREFKDSISGKSKDWDEDEDDRTGRGEIEPVRAERRDSEVEPVAVVRPGEGETETRRDVRDSEAAAPRAERSAS